MADPALSGKGKGKKIPERSGASRRIHQNRERHPDHRKGSPQREVSHLKRTHCQAEASMESDRRRRSDCRCGWGGNSLLRTCEVRPTDRRKKRAGWICLLEFG